MLVQFSSVQFSRSVMSDSLQPHELQHARPPCLSPTPGVHSNSHPSSRWCHPAVSSSVVPFSSCPQSLPASESFPMSQLFAWGGQSIGVSALASLLPKNTQDWSPSEWTGWISLQSKGLSRVFSNTTVQKHQFFGAQLSSQSNFGVPRNKDCPCFHCLPVCLPWSAGCHGCHFLNVEFKTSLFLLSFFTFIKRLFSSSSLSAIRVVSSAYLRLFIFFWKFWFPSRASSSPVFYMMYSVYKLNKQGDNIQPWRAPVSIWNQSFVPCPVLTVASWTACRFLRMKLKWSGIPISLRVFHSLLRST